MGRGRWTSPNLHDDPRIIWGWGNIGGWNAVADSLLQYSMQHGPPCQLEEKYGSCWGYSRPRVRVGLQLPKPRCLRSLA